jgi:transcription initiation factor TFIIB
MVTILPSNRILITKSNDNIDKINRPSETPSVCPSCKRENTIITDPKIGEIICSKCGMVLSDKLSNMRSDKHPYVMDESEGRTSTGLPSLAIHDMGLSTVIGKENTDAHRNKIEPSMLLTMHRLRTWDFRTQVHNSSDKSLRIAFTELDILKDKLGLSDAIIERTAYIYRKAQERGILRGRSILAVLAAAIYITCRQLDAPRTLDDIATISNIKRKSIAKYDRELIFQLNLKVPFIDTTKCISRVANKANISEKTKHQAIDLMNDVVKNGIAAGKDPMGLAATVLYVSCIRTGEQKTKVELASAAQTTEVTIRNRFKDLKNRLELHD